MHSRPIITLLSDFGLKDSYVAEMKAVILSICPKVHIIDISHEIKKFDIRMGAFLLARAARFFPKGTVHVAVIDPGVGSGRRPIIAETERGFYVGPDNGVLMLSAQMDGIKRVYVVKEQKYMLERISRTFHGRDIFSPVAAYLASGVPPSKFGPEIFDPVIPNFAKPKVSGNLIEGEVIHIDDFGNIVTNITHSNIESIGIREGEMLGVRFGDKDLKIKLCSAYSEVQINTPLTIIGSADFLEVSINQGDASKLFGVKVGEKIFIYKLVN